MSIRSEPARGIVVALGLLSCLGAATLDPSECQAQAAPTAEQRAQAREHFERGRQHHERGEYLEAAQEYQRAHDLSLAPKLLFNIAQVYRLAGDRTSSIAYYERYLAEEPEGEISDVAREQLVELKRELETDPDRATPSITDAARPSERPEDTPAETTTPETPPGSTPDHARSSAAGTGESTAPDTAPDTTPDTTTDTTPDTTSSPRSRPQGRAILRYSGLATGALGLVGLGLAVKYRQDAARISDDLNDVTWSRELDDRVRDGEAAERTMWIAAGVGAATVTTGALLYILGRRASPARDENLVIAPRITHRMGAVVLSGRF